MRHLPPRPFLEALLDPRTRIDTERFGRTSLRPSWGLADRRVDEHYLTVYLDGGAEVAAADIAGTCRPGSALLVAPQVPHSIRLRGPRMTFYHWRFRLRDARGPFRCRVDALLRPRSVQIRPLMDAAWDAMRHDGALADLRLRSPLAAVLAELLDVEPAAAAGLGTRQRAAVLSWVAERLPRPIHPGELAAACGLTLDYFSRRFRATFGAAPRSWLLAERLRHAAEDLIANDDPIGAVADRWGFDSLFVFSRQFARAHRLSPSRYRRRFRS